MSNCVEVKSDILFLKEHCQDIDGFLKFLDEVRKLSVGEMNARTGIYTGRPMSDEQQDIYVAWWFLCGAVRLWIDGPDKQVRGLLWTPGRGCSSIHTFRDLEGTLRVLGRRLVAPGLKLRTPLDLVDVDDGNRELGTSVWDYEKARFYGA